MKIELTREKYLTEKEQKELVKTLNIIKGHRPRDYILMSLLFQTGARASEILHIRLKDILSVSAIYIGEQRGSEPRKMPIDNKLHKFIMKRISEVGITDPEQRLFDINDRRLRYIWYSLRPAYKTLHCLRHTYAINLYNESKSLERLQEALGHKTIENTKVYADFIMSKEEARRYL